MKTEQSWTEDSLHLGTRRKRPEKDGKGGTKWLLRAMTFSQLGCEPGVIQQALEGIAMSNKDGDVDLHVFDLIIHNMLAVLDPTAPQSCNCQNNFIELRNEAIWLRRLRLELDCLMQKAL